MNTTSNTQEAQNSVTVTDQTFASEILNSPQPVLLDLWAAWCGPCRMLGPIIEELAGEFDGRVKVAKLNVDENPETAARLRVSSLPTLLIFKNGRVADQVIGLVPKKLLVAKLLAQLS